MTTMAFLETPNAVRRRKVLMHLLTPILGVRKSLDAVVLWEQQFGSNETLLASTVEYSKLLCVHFNIKMNPLIFCNKFIQTLLKPPAGVAELHDPIGMGRIILERGFQSVKDDNTDRKSIF